jgi:hypothetical protein
MKWQGTIKRVQRSHGEMTVIIETDYGLRGIELDRDLWSAIQKDFGIDQYQVMVGWTVEYDPAHGDLEIVGPAESAGNDTDKEDAGGS